MRNIMVCGVATVLAVSAAVAADDTLNMQDETARINYSLGYQIGGDFKRQGVKMDAQAVVKGIEDALAGSQPLISQAEMHTMLTELKRKVVEEQQVQQRQVEAEVVKADAQFVEEFRKNKAVKVTASGLIYKILEPGKGRAPAASDTVTVNYRGTLSNGNEFDSSYKRGSAATFPLTGVIKGWTEGLQLIKEGGKIQLVIPPALAYGDRGPLAHRTLIFDVELLAIGTAGKAGAGGEGQH